MQHSVDSGVDSPNVKGVNYLSRLVVTGIATGLAVGAIYGAEPAGLRPLLTNNLSRAVRYWPVAGGFVITNGTEYFNRPLYGVSSAFRIDGGDKPQFSLYLPGRGGNLRFGLSVSNHLKWLDEAGSIVADYRAGALYYQIHDAWLGNTELRLSVMPMATGNGVVTKVEADIYLSVTFTAWPQNGGYFAYNRSTPSLTQPAPTITLTNPANNAVFAAPASLKLGANASVATGTITNVTFFGNGNPLGSVTGTPYTITAAPLSSGSYTLTAAATANGISTTSAIVNVSVITPATNQISSPKLTNGVWTFTYTVSPGLTYVVQNSSNLAVWLSLATNTPSSNTVRFTTNVLTVNSRFYRIARLPNP